MNQQPISRRTALAGAAATVTAAALSRVAIAQDASSGEKIVQKGRLNQSFCRWCYGKIDLETLAAHAKKIGLVGIDLLGADEFPVVKKHGIECTMTTSHGIAKGLNRKENWDECLDKIRKSIDATAEAGFKNVICFSGNTEGMDPQEGMKNCAEALKQVMSQAEQKKVTVQMELLNSKRNHQDYMCDNSKWGVALVKMVGSERFKLLYDIYHMQIDEGDVIATIKENKDYYGHYHTGGVPGRHEIDETQELYYPAIAKAIIDTGFKGYFAHEFVPKKDPLTSLNAAVKLCDV
ncbi:MAG TPA: TIM barrel protein [Tepidisphaeraceae bacterium]|jgi:hydroxypyruvate isomerase